VGVDRQIGDRGVPDVVRREHRTIRCTRYRRPRRGHGVPAERGDQCQQAGKERARPQR
jgi:hypothetical protein